MDKNIAIEFNNVGKQYRLGLVGTGSLQHDLNRWWQTTILGKEDPYLKIGEVNDRSKKGNSDYVWALKDISFKVEQGDVVGIIGKNGAGKSTLLKLLSHITAPTTGDIRYRGRIASLLEVGTGFHPEMTARQNIYMNGSIMGMTRHEITSKLDEIVDFAGIERYLDTPVKRFSSGMTVRLGFAVAAFLEPEILVVDEVLTVGDLEFQAKAIGKMKEVSSKGGRTVLFVSHNMTSIQRLCTSGVVLNNGMVDYIGSVNQAVAHYTNANVDISDQFVVINEKKHARNPSVSHDLEFIDARILNNPNAIAADEPIVFEFTIRCNRHNHDNFYLGIVVRDASSGIRVLSSYTDPMIVPLNKDTFKVRVTYKNHNLFGLKFNFQFELLSKHALGENVVDQIYNVLTINVAYKTKKNKEPLSAEWPDMGFVFNYGSEYVTMEEIE